MDTKQFDQTIADLNSQTAKLTAETNKIIQRNPYVPLAASSAVTLTFLAVVLLLY